MRKILAILSSFIVVSLLFISTAAPAFAAPCSGTQSGVGGTLANGINSHTIVMNLSSRRDQELVLQLNLIVGGGSIRFVSPVFKAGQNGTKSDGNGGTIKVEGDIATWTIRDKNFLEGKKPVEVLLYKKSDINTYIVGTQLCEVGSYTQAEFAGSVNNTSCELYIWQERGGKQCYSAGTNSCMIGGGVTTFISASNLKNTDGTPYNGSVRFEITGSGVLDFSKNASNGSVRGEFLAKDIGAHSVALRTETIYLGFVPIRGGYLCPKVSFKTNEENFCGNQCAEKTDAYADQNITAGFELCSQVNEDDARSECQECHRKEGIWTAVGCIPIKADSIIRTIITLGLGIGGGITLLLILAGAFQLSVSSGDAQKVQDAREQITSAIIGLLFIIFSITILRFIGVQFLQLPGFGGQ